ncbi:unnamed protein product [Candida verbasci]|uniref:Uncharacterized protein n=1 Tax=Candida verbasci TaxID=1227364 RepID=A0A9W4TRC3_9ASCO|nr:unnamed protein product [Candida verbasci]
MDLSNLSNNLPHSKPIRFKRRETEKEEEEERSTKSQDSTSITSDINHELTSNFKDAAKSVASLYNSSINNSQNIESVKSDFAIAAKSVATLYKLSQQQHDQLFNKGYLQCLTDFCSILTNDEDIENWVLTRKAELLKEQKSTYEEQPKTPSDDFKLGSNYDFYFNSDLKPPSKFRPSIPPLSVQHNLKQRNSNLKKLQKMKSFNSSGSSPSDETSESESDTNSNGKRQGSRKHSPLKKKKKLQ